jgi:sulfate transport system ATP-binding protein
VSITVEHLHKRFSEAGRPAVENVSFEAPPGAITSLLGPSGSGKTTVLRLIAGLERADSGRVCFENEELSGVPVQKRGVGFVFQGYALFEHLTVRRNVAFGLEVQRLRQREIDARVDELLALVQLEGYDDRHPSQLSGGQRQRIAFARALATRPRVLLLDEPFGALDARVRMELRGWLGELHRRLPVTTLLVTHDQDEAFELSEQVVVMHEGRVAQAGSPHDIYDAPATPFVASFIGNASSVRATDGDGRHGVAYVRPHDVRLVRPDDGPSDAPFAEVLTLVRIGGFVKVEIALATAERMTVQLSRTEADALSLRQGERVRVLLGERKVFVTGDYSI